MALTRVLFVDDDPQVLQSLQRSLHNRRNAWEMSFVGSGAEALALLHVNPYEVVVSDLRMPEMDGAELLEQIRLHYPAVIRIALSGCFERETALRAAGVVHQYISKPCNAEILAESIERFCASTTILSNETVRRVVGTVGRLPSLSRTAAELFNAFQSPTVSLREVGEIIRQDVAMSARVLQLVNSPLFGRHCQITDVPSALVLIGLDTLRRLVLMAEVFHGFEPEQQVAGFTLAEFQAHSGLTSRIAASLPLPTNPLPGCETAALLHDIGKLVLATRLPRQFEQNLALSREQGRPLHVVEAETIGANHAEIGAYLLSLWGLSPLIVEAICHHHDPAHGASTDDGLNGAGIVHLADGLAHSALENAPETGDADRFDLQYLDARGLADQLPLWKRIARESVARLGNPCPPTDSRWADFRAPQPR